MSPPTVDLSLPSDAQLLAAADPNPQTEAARLTATGDPARVADLGRLLQSTGRDLDHVHQQSWRTQAVLADGFANDGAPVYDATTHQRLLPAGFADTGTHLDAVGRRMSVVSEELGSAITDLGRSLDDLTADLGRQRSAFAAEVAAARGPGGLIPMDALAALQARRQAVAATMQETVNTCGRRVLGRIGVYELSLNDGRRLLAEVNPPTGTVTAASPGVGVPGPTGPIAGTRLEGQVSGLTVPAPPGPNININPIPPPYTPDRGFTPLPTGLDGPLINVPGPQGGSIYDGPGSGQRRDGPGIVINPNTGGAGSGGPPAAGSGDPVAGARPHRGNFPREAGPNEVLVRRGNDGKVNSYEVYGPDGLPVKRVDVRGRAHAGIETPHVLEFERHTNPRTGQEFIIDGDVRAARPDETTGLL